MRWRARWPAHRVSFRLISARIFLSVSLLSGLLPGCARIGLSARDAAALAAVEAEKEGNTLGQRLSERRNRIRMWAERCGAVAAKQGCDVGDATLFNGILCLSGEAASCAAVARSQSADGRMWRAPQRVGYEAADSFSRDMALGVLAYLVATQDRALASRWLAWVEANGDRMCLAASDNRCGFTPGFWNLFGGVWAYMRLPQSARMQADPFDNEFVLPLQARVAPVGFALHLTAVNIVLRRAMGQDSELLRLAAGTLAERQPENPFFAWVHEGNTPAVMRLTLARCPADPPARRDEWSFERSADADAHLSSMGWECVALINFLVGTRGASVVR